MLSSVCSRIEEITGRPARPAGQHMAAGGSIHSTSFLDLEDGRRFFIKMSPRPLPRVFELEAQGLEALRRAADSQDFLRVPTVLAFEPTGGAEASGGAEAFLILEAIENGPAKPGFQAAFGAALAEMHRASAAEHDAYGFADSNYIGATPQENPWTANWVDFWRAHRLEFQLRLIGNGISGELTRLGEQLGRRLGEFLPASPEACLLHGDLWGGNYLCDEVGRAVLIDPAAYVGHREADIAMTRLFGGFDADFYRGYEGAWRLEPGSQERLLIYELYHLMNHVILFGAGYLGGCLQRLRRLVG